LTEPLGFSHLDIPPSQVQKDLAEATKAYMELERANTKQAADIEELKQQLQESAAKLAGLEQQLAEKQKEAVGGHGCTSW
jgi:division protein CdvB (Snf7/Vps24/ESCRT-III family)